MRGEVLPDGVKLSGRGQFSACWCVVRGVEWIIASVIRIAMLRSERDSALVMQGGTVYSSHTFLIDRPSNPLNAGWNHHFFRFKVPDTPNC